MQFQLSGQQIVVTPALRDHVTSKLDRLTRLDDKLHQPRHRVVHRQACTNVPTAR